MPARTWRRGGIKKERDAMESGRTARHHHTDAAVVDKKRGRSSAPFNRNATSRATRERYTRAMCSVLNPEAELMESPFMMQRGEFGVHSLS